MSERIKSRRYKKENKIRVFIGKNVTRLMETVYYHSHVTEFEPDHNYAPGDCISMSGESKKIIHNLESFVRWIEKGYGYHKEPIFFTDFLGLIDEAMPVKAYFERILNRGAEIFYFAERDTNIERIKSCGLPIEIYRKSDN